MSNVLPTALLVQALLKRVNDAGGLGVVRARGDAESGAVLTILADGEPRLLEQGYGTDGLPAMIESRPTEDVELYWKRRRQRDPDLWVIELDIPSGERLVAETIFAR